MEINIGNIIKEKRESLGLSLSSLAFKIGVTGTTIWKWEKGLMRPSKYDHAKALSEVLNIDIAILLNDPSFTKGLHPWAEPVPPTEAAATPPSVQPPPIKQVSPVQGQEFRISDALHMCARVLESGTSYATALYLNIQHFDRAVQAETVVKNCQDELHVMGVSIAKMQVRMDDLEKENRNLQEEIRKLKGTSGGLPPIALGMDHAAPTGTEDPEA